MIVPIAESKMRVDEAWCVLQDLSYPLSLPTYFGVVCQSNYFVLVQLPRKRYTIHDFKILVTIKTIWSGGVEKLVEKMKSVWCEAITSYDRWQAGDTLNSNSNSQLRVVGSPAGGLQLNWKPDNTNNCFQNVSWRHQHASIDLRCSRHTVNCSIYSTGASLMAKTVNRASVHKTLYYF